MLHSIILLFVSTSQTTELVSTFTSLHYIQLITSYLPSSFMPILRHFSKRHAGHFLRVAMVTGHEDPRRQT
jgi:hypothetical protein